MKSFPIFDMHCDLLAYLATTPGADAMNSQDIGCAIPHLQAGNVKLQVQAMFTKTEAGSSKVGQQESAAYRDLLRVHADKLLAVTDVQTIEKLPESEKIGVVPAIENASGFCEEDDALTAGFAKLEQIIERVGRLLYITITHHTENRFGGGNMSDNVGLKGDGEALLDYLDGRKIAIDFSHTSDALAEGILTYTTKHSLAIPVLASHSNFRAVFDHARNLPDEIVQEIVQRNGIVAVNFIRDFLGRDDPRALTDHLLHGVNIGAAAHLAFGADYFYPGDFPQRKAYHDDHDAASKYPAILSGLESVLTDEQIAGIGYKNAAAFLRKLWR